MPVPITRCLWWPFFKRPGRLCYAKSTARLFRWVLLSGSEEGASRLLAAGGMGALLRLLDGACHAALLPLALSTLAGTAAACVNACTQAHCKESSE